MSIIQLQLHLEQTYWPISFSSHKYWSGSLPWNEYMACFRYNFKPIWLSVWELWIWLLSICVYMDVFINITQGQVLLTRPEYQKPLWGVPYWQKLVVVGTQNSPDSYFWWEVVGEFEGAWGALLRTQKQKHDGLWERECFFRSPPPPLFPPSLGLLDSHEGTRIVFRGHTLPILI